MQVIIMNLF